MVPLFTDIRPSGGGTLIAPESIDMIAQYLASHEAGVSLEDFQFTQIRDACKEFVELTGQMGDVSKLLMKRWPGDLVGFFFLS